LTGFLRPLLESLSKVCRIGHQIWPKVIKQVELKIPGSTPGNSHFKNHDRARRALRFVGNFSDKQVELIYKWICKYQDRMKLLDGYYTAREVFINKCIIVYDPFACVVSREERVQIWDAICVSLRTQYDGFDLLAIDTWWKD